MEGCLTCEELVGSLTGDDGVGFLGIKYSSKVEPFHINFLVRVCLNQIILFISYSDI